MSVSSLYVDLSIYCEEINGVTTKFDVQVPNNLQAILDGAKTLLYNNSQYLYVKFYYMGSFYRVQNEKLKTIGV